MAEFVHEATQQAKPTAAEVGIDPKDVPPLISDQDSSVTAGATTTTATMISA